MATETATAQEAKVTVKPLLCPSCAGAVPLADGDQLTCPYCGASVPVPESYRTIRDANRVAEADRAHVEAAYAELGQPPGALLRFWAKTAKAALWIVRWWSFLPLIVLFGYVMTFPLAARLGELAPRWGFCLQDVLGLLPYMMGCTLAFALVFLIAPILFRYRSAMAACRGTLSAGMAARPPTTAGGPAICRECGAPLSVPAGALGVRCSYCGTDNLVALPPDWVKEMRSASAARHADVTSALAAEVAERRSARGTLLWQAIGGVAFIGLTAGLFWGVGRDHGLPGWRHAVAESPRPIYFAHAEYTPSNEDPYQELRSGSERAFTLDDHDCAEAACFLLVKVPLKKGETFELDSPDLPRGTTASVETPWNQVSPDVPWKTSLPRRENLYRYSEQRHTGTITLTAPFSGWFVVRATLDGMRPNPKMPARLDTRVTVATRS